MCPLQTHGAKMPQITAQVIGFAIGHGDGVAVLIAFNRWDTAHFAQ